jgi:hypothetical protein
MSKLIDRTGQRFGRITVLELAGKDKSGLIMWECRCDCGALTIVRASDLVSGNTSSCGCLSREISQTVSLKHGKSNTRLFWIWCHIKQRCFDLNDKNYSRYGGRGISVCPEWLSFQPFYDWAIENGYNEKLTIDRIDNDGSYQPSNCRWATMQEQRRNTDHLHYLTFQSKTAIIKDWAESVGLKPTTLLMRIRLGWPIEKALTTPVKTWRKVV